MASFSRKTVWVACLVCLVTLAGCSSSPILADKWHLPKRENAQSAMIIGRIELPADKKENPDGYHLYLNRVVFLRRGHVYFGGGTMPKGEDDYIMNDKNYFVVPNIKPGKYLFGGFATGDIYNTVSTDSKDFFTVKPGEIKFVGSFDYLEQKQGFLSKLAGLSGSYDLRRARHPTELEMLHWLEHVGAGSGWESTIRHRIHELGGRP